MTQEQYNVIVKVLQNGVPALSTELIGSINDLLKSNAELVNQLKGQKQESAENVTEE